jgi:small conductance mechanosensitive channel
VLGAIILMVAGYIVGRRRRAVDLCGHGPDQWLRRDAARFFSKAARYAVLVFVGVTVLAQFGVQTASIIAALGAAGLAIGLALQGTLQNIAAGIMILVLRPFRVGEFITAGSVSGGVQEVGLFATELKTFDGIYMLVPNSQLWNTAVTNFSRNPTAQHRHRDRHRLWRRSRSGPEGRHGTGDAKSRACWPIPPPAVFVAELATVPS